MVLVEYYPRKVFTLSRPIPSLVVTHQCRKPTKIRLVGGWVARPVHATAKFAPGW